MRKRIGIGLMVAIRCQWSDSVVTLISRGGLALGIAYDDTRCYWDGLRLDARWM